MFRNKTVFILGAGASWHYGYPTSEGLVDHLKKMAIALRDHCNARVASHHTIQEVPQYVEGKIDRSKGTSGGSQAWKSVLSECQTFIDRIEVVRPTMIDYFLGWNKSLQPIGKLLIAAVILSCEANYRNGRGNQNRPTSDKSSSERDRWHRFLTQKLLVGCEKSADLLKNNVRFITFNYDTSLEDVLFQSLTSMDLLEEQDVKKFLEKDRIIHVYGSVHPSIPTESDFARIGVADHLGEALLAPIDFQRDLVPRKAFLDQCLKASEGLRTIDPHDKDSDDALINRARDWIASSDIVYILGYGFDENNNRRLDLSRLLRVKAGNDKSVMFTNYEDTNTVNKKASRVFYGTYNRFLGEFVSGFPSKGNYREKSVRTVYESLQKDFDALESLLIAGSSI